MKIALVQYNPIWEDKQANMNKLKEMLKSISGVELILFPEMSLTGFMMKSEEMSEGIHGESFRYFSSDLLSI